MKNSWIATITEYVVARFIDRAALCGMNPFCNGIDWKDNRAMARKRLVWLWAHRKRAAGALLLASALLLNGIAFMHARAMTHFTRDGTRTPPPESLSYLEKAGVMLTGVCVPRPTIVATPEQVGLSFTTHRLQGDAGELEAWHVRRANARGLVLMFHGYASCKAALLPEAKAFHELGYATLLLDFRGSGGSSGSETTIGYTEADDVACAVAFARAEWPGQPLGLYGQSMGSAAILRAVAVHGIQPDALIVESPFDRLLSTVENRFDAMKIPSFPFARLLVFWGGAQHGFNGFEHNPIDHARHVRCPVLHLQGEVDPRVTRQQADAIFEKFSGDKRFVLFPGVGHRPLLSERPDQWQEAVSEFLNASLGH
jgi:alpha-beta hydrolase superfamily lysophospholipase